MDWRIFFTALAFLVSLVIAVLTIVGMVKAAIKTSRDETTKEIEALSLKVDTNEKSLEEKLGNHNSENDKRFEGVYRRMDEERHEAERRFMTKELANVMHEATAKSIGALERKFDDMRTDVRVEMGEIKNGQRDLIKALTVKGAKND